jgi:hypothetical protein
MALVFTARQTRRRARLYPLEDPTMRVHFRSARTNKAICMNNGTPMTRAAGAHTTAERPLVTCQRCLRALEIQDGLDAKRAARAAREVTS